MANWIALSDGENEGREGAGGTLLTRGSFVLEFDLPLDGPSVLLDFRAQNGWERAFSIFVDPAGGVSIAHRQGDRLRRYVLPGSVDMRTVGPARLTLVWDAPARWWRMRLEQPGGVSVRRTQGRDPMPMMLDDVQEICRSDGQTARHRAVAWFGVTSGRALPDSGPWIGLNTPIDTAAGPRLAGSLRPGDLVVSDFGGVVPVRSVRQINLPSRGSFAPVLLRAPYFGGRVDLLVSSDQMILQRGPEVEYLFGEDQVLAEARHLTDGRSALFDQRRTITSCISLDLGGASVLWADGCALISHDHDGSGRTTGKALPGRLLHSYETVPL
ncbi:MAG: Hint domain-containing protein, partial [Paracoccaceae bacterium]|nr:Hint domain-containing protein [Paracoccaceae bacterium]